MLSDHVFSFFGRTITVTSQEQMIAIVVIVAAVATWLVQQFRRRRVVILHRSPVSDQLLSELARIAEALERIANRPADQVIAAANREGEASRTVPLSIFGERPHS